MVAVVDDVDEEDHLRGLEFVNGTVQAVVLEEEVVEEEQDDDEDDIGNKSDGGVVM